MPEAQKRKPIIGTLMVYPEGAARIAEIDHELLESEHLLFKFFVLGKQTKHRYRTLFIKEPETIKWLSRIGRGEVLWDVGANIGIYTVFAAMARGARVLAFEPLSANYYILNKNIELNGLAGQATAYCLAFTDRSSCDVMQMTGSAPGAAGASYAEAIDDRGRVFEARTTQGMLGFTIDEFIERYNPVFPNHLKIDVDGLESKVITGAQRTLADDRLRSLSIELDSARSDYVNGVCEGIEAGGLYLTASGRSPYIAPNSTIRNFHFERSVSAAQSAATQDAEEHALGPTGPAVQVRLAAG